LTQYKQEEKKLNNNLEIKNELVTIRSLSSESAMERDKEFE
jgi:hypothetical protein